MNGVAVKLLTIPIVDFLQFPEWIHQFKDDGVGLSEGDHFIPRNASPSLSLALSNRASCLLRAGHFEAALADVDLAIWAGYPEEKLHREQ